MSRPSPLVLTTQMVRRGTSEVPVRCLANPVSNNSVIFAGVAINLQAIARDQDIDYTYVSRLFSGNRTPSIPMATKLASALGMTRGAFLTAWESHVAAKIIKDERARLDAEESAPAEP